MAWRFGDSSHGASAEWWNVTRTLDFSHLLWGPLSNDEDEVAKAILDLVTAALLEDGKVHLIDPNDALRSRVKHHFWNIRFRVNAWLFEHLNADWEDPAVRNPILIWMDDHHLFGWYDLDAYDSLPKGHLQFTHLTGKQILALWAETGPKS